MGTAEALERLMVDAGMRREMGQAGRKRLEERFTQEVFEERMKEILDLELRAVELS